MNENAIHNAETALAIETSGRIGSVALGGDSQVVVESAFSGFMRQGAELFPHIRTMLQAVQRKPADIGTVIITVGPGSFTGLRIAVTAAKMMFLARQVKVVAVDSTDVIAENAPETTATGQRVDCVCTVLDAKRGLFYASVFERAAGGWEKIFGTQAVGATELLDWLRGRNKKKVYFLGEGLVYYADKFKAPFTEMLDEQYWMPRAGNLFRVGRRMAAAGKFADPVALTPLYIRQPDAVEKNRKHGTK